MWVTGAQRLLSETQCSAAFLPQAVAGWGGWGGRGPDGAKTQQMGLLWSSRHQERMGQGGTDRQGTPHRPETFNAMKGVWAVDQGPEEQRKLAPTLAPCLWTSSVVEPP